MAKMFAEEIKAMKWFAKQDQFLLARYDDCYYISNGCFVVKVSAMFYDKIVRPIDNKVLIELKEEESASRLKKDSPVETSFSSFKIWEFFDWKKAETPVYKTKWILDLQNDFKHYVRKFETEKEHEAIYVDDGVLDLLSCFNPADVWYGSGKRGPILTDPRQIPGVLMLPVNVNVTSA